MFVVNFNKIKDAPNIPAIIKLMAVQILQAGTYVRLGDWIQEVTDYDLECLTNMCEDMAEDHTCAATGHLALMVMMLMQAEGIDPASNGLELEKHMAFLVGMIASEGLKRGGVVDIDYSNLSFGADAYDLDIIKRVPKNESDI
jgi:hypothetical protein